MSATDSKPTPERIRRRVIYAGFVQGVGFRWTARELAGRFDVGGYVRNLPDGTVELEAEGRVGEVDGLLAAIAKHFRDNIKTQQVSNAQPTGEAGPLRIEH